MKDLVDVAAELQAFAEERGWEFCFIGGLAVQALAEPRLPRDARCCPYLPVGEGPM
jgi:hypothetical protein